MATCILTCKCGQAQILSQKKPQQGGRDLRHVAGVRFRKFRCELRLAGRCDVVVLLQATSRGEDGPEAGDRAASATE